MFCEIIKRWSRTRFYLSCNRSSTTILLVKILLFKLKNLKLNLRYNKVVTQLGHFSSSQLNCKTIWIWNFNGNLIMALLLTAVWTVLFWKLYSSLRWQEPMKQKIVNFYFKMFKVTFSKPSECSKATKISPKQPVELLRN